MTRNKLVVFRALYLAASLALITAENAVLPQLTGDADQLARYNSAIPGSQTAIGFRPLTRAAP